ncbi:MAG TPA: Rne/Rng family ribonuclease [Acidimicrobiales bacterium]|nr:Rne/Rng family ribonuclease [Acidimicrobiales bacterium]
MSDPTPGPANGGAPGQPSGNAPPPEKSGGGRRRGSRGRGRRGRGHSGTGNPTDVTGAQDRPSGNGSPAAERRVELPDPPGEGRPRPRIGDSRPAPPLIPKVPPPRPRSAEAPAAGPPAANGDDQAGGGKKSRRRGGRGRSGGKKQPAARTPAVDLDEAVERPKARERKGRPVGRYLMCVHAHEGTTQIAVLEGRSLIEHYVSRAQDDATQIDGNIYLGRVQNVLPGMEAAFVDIGTPKNAVLYRGDVRYDADDLESGGKQSQARIEHLLRPGQSIRCQVTKNPIGTKGARLTQEVSIPGRFVVLVPDSNTYGISKRLPDDERKRLRRILDQVRPEGHGLIVRTAAQGVSADELSRDVAQLLGQWQRIEAATKRTAAPALLHREPDMAVRVIREEFNHDYRGVVIDDETLFREVREYVESISPELADRVEYFDEKADGLPVFERYHVHEQLHRALDRKVWLPSGGSLIIERTEALTVIDVNTGKNVGTSNLEETVFRNNLEAAEEVARQLRLRDLGGIIVIDFIDMEIVDNRAEVLRVFRDALARDKTRTQVFDISELGLVEMTRKRVSEGLVESFSVTCPSCAGRGIVFDETLL